MSDRDQPQTTASDDTPPSPGRRPLLSATLGIVVIFFAVGVTLWMVRNPVRAKRRKPKAHATVVKVEPVKIANHRVRFSAMGRVSAAEQVALQPRVKGEVLAISKELMPGGRVKKGDVLLRIDASDYTVASQQASASLARAKADLELERGQQASVRRELSLVGGATDGLNRDLVLRGPQLRKAQANLTTAQAALKRARLDLKRTVLRSPTNAVVLTRDVNVGTRVSESTRLAQLVGTDAFWVELLVPVDNLRWIEIPQLPKERGSTVRLRDAAWPKGQTREARILRLAPDLEEKGRMARVIVEITDPLCVQASHRDLPRLLIGSWVEATVEGRELTSVAVVPRERIHDGNQVWLLDRAGKLIIRSVTIAYRDTEQVLVTQGLSSTDRLVASDIAAPVAGMLLRTKGKKSGAQAQGKGKGWRQEKRR